MKRNKKKLTLTIDPKLIELAKKVAAARGESLSSMVEAFLRQVSAELDSHDWLQRFHSEYLTDDYREPSDKDIEALRSELIKR